MGYKSALEKAGAEVHDFKHFGSYQGDWFAKVTYKGETGFIHGYYGSCSQCDVFEGEFGDVESLCNTHRWDDNPPETCQPCREMEITHNVRLKDFGERYLDNILTKEQSIKQASINLEWDGDAQSMIDYLKGV